MPALIRWEPFAELTEMRTRFDRLLDDLGDGRLREWAPAVDIVRENGHMLVSADVPGFKPEEISIEVEKGVLTVSGRHEESSEATDEKFVRRERRYGSFLRRVSLPEGVDAKKIKATTHDGVLEVTVPLPKQAAPEPVTITPTAA
jgi:HSP20 family protein